MGNIFRQIYNVAHKLDPLSEVKEQTLGNKLNKAVVNYLDPDYRLYDRKRPQRGYKKGGKVKMGRGDGKAVRGKTKGRFI